MARLFVRGSQQYITPSALPAESGTISVSYWYYHASTPGNAGGTRFFTFYRGNGTQADINWATIHTLSNLQLQYTTASTTYVTLSGAYTADTGTWHNVVFSSDFSSANTAIYLDGTALSTSTSGTPGTPETSFTDVPVIGGPPAPSGSAEYMDGRMADLGLWNVRLSAGEASGLGKGAIPSTVRPASLVGFWPLDGLQSPEPDLSGNAQNGTLTVAPALAAGPPVMMFTARWPQFNQIVAVAPSFKAAWALGKNVVVEGVAT